MNTVCCEKAVKAGLGPRVNLSEIYSSVFFYGNKSVSRSVEHPYEHRAANRLLQDRARKHVMNNYQRKDLGGNAVPTACYFYHPMSRCRRAEGV